ncbi:hypothetical protein SAMN05421858_2183 [Haladaptatus litoreus]|uniref:Phage PhiH1 repressor protein n=1 Tax=Haladaptatus litoreus TaxID=553468 RepID=A0A1N6ZUV4_9EURY|nr:phage repressor protein [Haladaptatus litoreus]SIR30595.1 hypothetical protein SAMN05421858_2183 [Haladaptatus litoreus]
MRRHAEWMAHADERIVEFLADYGNHQPSQITDGLAELGPEMDYHPKYVGRRCRTLAAYGLLRNLGNGLYQVTDEGRAYLAGELDASELTRNDE